MYRNGQRPAGRDGEDPTLEIVPDLHQLKTPMPSPALPYILAYAFLGGDGVSLFDTGYGTPEAIEAMTGELRRLGCEPKDIRRVMISHAHPDHMGMVGWVKEQSPDCEVVMLEREWEWMSVRFRDGENSDQGMSAFMRRSDGWLVRHGVPQEEVEEAHLNGRDGPPGASRNASGQRNPFGSWQTAGEPAVLLQDGEVIDFDGWSLRAVWTPGHTPGHLCMYERNHKLMFTGDHVLPHITPNVSLYEDQEGTSPLSDFRDSLRKVGEFDTAMALPAHEFNIRDLPARCAALIHHHDDRLDEVRAAIGEATATARDVSTRVHWNTGPFQDFNLHTKRAALGETLSHLQLLLDDGRVKRRDDGEQMLWEQA